MSFDSIPAANPKAPPYQKDSLTDDEAKKIKNGHNAKLDVQDLKNKNALIYFVCVVLATQIGCVNVYVYLIINYAISNKIQLNQINLTLNIFIAGTLASIFILVKIIVNHFFNKK